MARYTTNQGFGNITGALKKDKKASRLSITRIKSVKDPLTGEVIGEGPKEMYLQNKRDYEHHPMTAREKSQRERWRAACRLASEIVKDPSHPRYMELYERWRSELSSGKPCKQFPNFVRSVLVAEM